MTALPGQAGGAGLGTPVRVDSLHASSDRERIAAWLVEKVAGATDTPPSEIDEQTPLTSYGLDSMQAALMVGDLERWLDLRLEDAVLWNHPAIGPLSDYLAGQVAGREVGTPAGAATVTADADADIKPEHYRIELFPGYRGLHDQLEDLERRGVDNPYFRTHEGITGSVARVGGRELINFANFNYLGLSGHPAVARAAHEAIDMYGTSVSASRVVSGERLVHRQLETALAAWLGVDGCVTFPSGYATNVITIGHLLGPHDAVLQDALIHNSIQKGGLMSRAAQFTFPHNDWEAVDARLREVRRRYERVLIVVEGAYSMDGDIADLPHFIDVKRRHRALLMVDEAHSIGVLGARGHGAGEHFGLDRSDVDIWMGTLSKSLASGGGYVAGSRSLIEYLKYTAPGFVYSTGMPPADAAAALAALRQLSLEPERVAQLRSNAALFLRLVKNHGLNTGFSAGTPIVPVIVGDSVKTLELSNLLFQQGINVPPMIAPAVPEAAARLRFFIASTHTGRQLHTAADALARGWSDVGRPPGLPGALGA